MRFNNNNITADCCFRVGLAIKKQKSKTCHQLDLLHESKLSLPSPQFNSFKKCKIKKVVDVVNEVNDGGLGANLRLS